MLTLSLLNRFQRELYLAVKSGKLRFKLFELLFLLPRSVHDLLQNRNILGYLFRVSLKLLNQAGYLLQGVQEVHAGELRVSRDPPVVVTVLHSTFSHHEELVLRKVEKVFGGGFCLDHEIKSVECSDIEILSPCAGFLVDFQEFGSNAFRVASFHPFERYRIENIAVLILLHTALVQIPVTLETGNQLLVAVHRPHDFVQSASGG